MIFRTQNINYKKSTDELLMQALQNGEALAFDEIYKRYHNRLLYYFYRMLGANQEIAEDFLQETFYKILNKPHLYNPEKTFSTWIFSIAHNLCKNEYRSREVRAIMQDEENPDKYLTENKVSEKQMETELIYKTLDSFDENHKTVFLFKYREGFTIEEIAEIMDLPKGTVKSRLHYTKQQLKVKLSAHLKTELNY